jgi:hypothetical protein
VGLGPFSSARFGSDPGRSRRFHAPARETKPSIGVEPNPVGLCGGGALRLRQSRSGAGRDRSSNRGAATSLRDRGGAKATLRRDCSSNGHRGRLPAGRISPVIQTLSSLISWDWARFSVFNGAGHGMRWLQHSGWVTARVCAGCSILVGLRQLAMQGADGWVPCFCLTLGCNRQVNH